MPAAEAAWPPTSRERQVLGDARTASREAGPALAAYYEQVAPRSAGRAEVEAAVESPQLAGGDPWRHERRERAGRQRHADVLINGRKLVGAMPFESFKAVIDAELSSRSRRSNSRPWPASRRCPPSSGKEWRLRPLEARRPRGGLRLLAARLGGTRPGAGSRALLGVQASRAGELVAPPTPILLCGCSR